MLYPKINTVFKRDPETKYKGLIMGDYSESAFEYLANNLWTFTEKVDGTNIRVMFRECDGRYGIEFGGRTDEAQIPAKLVAKLQQLFTGEEREAKLREVFPDGAILFGEGYGAGIQAVGKQLGDSQDFALFDVRVGAFWLERANVEDVAIKLGLKIAPIIGEGTLINMVDTARYGFPSRFGAGPEAEGIVARPATELCDRAGKRIITKIKYKDFPR